MLIRDQGLPDSRSALLSANFADLFLLYIGRKRGDRKISKSYLLKAQYSKWQIFFSYHLVIFCTHLPLQLFTKCFFILVVQRSMSGGCELGSPRFWFNILTCGIACIKICTWSHYWSWLHARLAFLMAHMLLWLWPELLIFISVKCVHYGFNHCYVCHS